MMFSVSSPTQSFSPRRPSSAVQSRASAVRAAGMCPGMRLSGSARNVGVDLPWQSYARALIVVGSPPRSVTSGSGIVPTVEPSSVTARAPCLSE